MQYTKQLGRVEVRQAILMPVYIADTFSAAAVESLLNVGEGFQSDVKRLLLKLPAVAGESASRYAKGRG